MQTCQVFVSNINWIADDDNIKKTNSLPSEVNTTVEVSDITDEDDVRETIYEYLTDHFDSDMDDDFDYDITDEVEDDCESDEDLELLHETEN